MAAISTILDTSYESVVESYSSAAATGGLVASYAAALVDPSNERLVQAVTDLGGDYQSVAQACTVEGGLRYLEELYDSSPSTRATWRFWSSTSRRWRL